MTTSFNIEIVERASSLILVIRGELDISTARLLDDELGRAEATDAATIVVDLDHVDFIDSSGLHVLIKHACSDQSRRRVGLTKGSPQAQRLFKLTGTLDHLPFVSPD
ncbi:MAG: STAS domain-containing protein [Actinomycetota bacterium]|nr:STAS domain-containing protein [Actinomycetota bacterium]